jgi:N-acetylneuraminic acid mutarotase
MDRFSILRFIVIIFLLLAFKTQAGDNSLALNLKWNNISQQQYLDNLEACETTIQSYKWANQIWPKSNNEPKPSFASIVQSGEIRKQLLTNLKKQAILTRDFNLDITSAMVQHDLNRMAQNSRSPQKLNQLFKLLGNDAQTIAHCLSRSYLVKTKFSHIFNYHKEIHSENRLLAKQELKHYQTTGITKNLKASITQFSYQKENPNEFKSKHSLTLTDSIQVLNEDDYSNKLKQLHKPQLIETDYGFNYQTIVAQSQNKIDVVNFNWPKQTEFNWLHAKSDHFEIKATHYKNLELPNIAPQAKPFDEKSVTADSWINGESTPIGRYGHTAIWTGTEMIVWGGIGGGQYQNTGGRYNPVTDSWTLTSAFDAPSPRAYHTAVWTGNEMIIWGGAETWNIETDSGSRYSPSNDSWSPLASVGTSFDRQKHTAVWTGTEMIVWGGYSNGSDLKSGARYNLTNDTWTLINLQNAPEHRHNHTAIWTGDEMIVWGGRDEGTAKFNSGGRYQPDLDSWTATNIIDAPSGRQWHSVVWTGSKMVIWGGNGAFSEMNSGGIYDPTLDSWTATTTNAAPTIRNRHAAIWDGDEMIIWGGITSDPGGRYHLASDTWQPIDNLSSPSSRVNATAIWTGAEMIVWGGGGSGIDTGGRYNPNTDNWVMTAQSNAPSSRLNHTAIWTGNEMIIWGGFNDNTSFNSGGLYEPMTNTWLSTRISGAPTRRGHHTALWTGTEMLIWGGMTGFYTGFQNSGGRYNPLMDSWVATEMTNAPSARTLHTAVWTGQEMIVWGGDGGLDTGGRYNPSTNDWLAVENTNAPTGRSNHTAIWTGDEMIIWGGWNVNDLNTGGHYNPDTGVWMATEITNAPTPRREHTALWDGSEMIIWGAGAVNDNTGGRYNTSAKTWTATETLDAPDKRKYHTAVLADSEMIIWGGQDANAPVNSGGRYNLATNTWTPTTTLNAPVGRIYHTAVWTGDEMIVWGGDPRLSVNIGSISTSIGTYVTDNWYAVAGYVNGLLPNNPLSLQLNGGSDLIVSNEGSFMFLTLLRDGESYNVTIDIPATDPTQTCQIVNGNGQISGADVSNIQLNCQMGDDLIFKNSFE